MNLNVVLNNLGFSEKESRVYLALIELGESSIASIAKRAGVKRPTVYRIVEELVGKGIIARVPKQEKNMFIAEPPEALIEHLESRLSVARSAFPLLKELSFRAGKQPRIKFYEGREDIVTLLYDSIRNNESREVCWIWPMKDAFQVLGEEENQRYIQERIRARVHSKNIRPKQKEVPLRDAAHGKKFLREVRYSPEEFDYSVTVGIYDQKVSVFSSEKENFGFLIESKEFSSLMKQLFQLLWSVSTPAK